MTSWNTALAEEMERITAEMLIVEEERNEKVAKARESVDYVVATKKPFNPRSFTRNKFEKWTDVDGYNGWYKVSTAGKVWSAHSNKILKPVEHPYSGYLKLRLKDPHTGDFNTHYLHRLVATHFLDNPEGKPEVNHNDGNKNNCSVWNLSFMTREENMRHAQMHGLGNVKLKPIEVQSIYYLAWATDINQEDIAKMYGVSRGVISSIKNRNTWEFMTDSNVQAQMGLFE